MQPYQEATEEIKRQGELPFKIAKNIGAVGATAATGYLGKGAMNRVLPFLSKYIPEDLVIKGLNKIDPRYGKFISKAKSGGKSIDEIKQFIGSQIEDYTQENQKQKKPAKQDRNIIEQYSPDLHQFLLGHIKSGRQPAEAAALATLDKTGQKSFKSIIKKITQDHKIPWSELVESIYSIAQSSQIPEMQQTQPQQSMEQTGGKGQQALMDVLQRINQKLGQ